MGSECLTVKPHGCGVCSLKDGRTRHGLRNVSTVGLALRSRWIPHDRAGPASSSSRGAAAGSMLGGIKSAARSWWLQALPASGVNVAGIDLASRRSRIVAAGVAVVDLSSEAKVDGARFSTLSGTAPIGRIVAGATPGADPAQRLPIPMVLGGPLAVSCL